MNFTTEQAFPLIALILISLAVIFYFTMKRESVDDVAPIDTPQQIEIPQELANPAIPQETQDLAPSAPAPEIPAEITAADLLPANNEAQAFESKFPNGEGAATDKNFLIAGYNIGINTVGSSLKNANLQLRSDPYIPRKSVGPWNESTIMSSDLTNRRTLEIGSA